MYVQWTVLGGGGPSFISPGVKFHGTNCGVWRLERKEGYGLTRDRLGRLGRPYNGVLSFLSHLRLCCLTTHFFFFFCHVFVCASPLVLTALGFWISCAASIIVLVIIEKAIHD